MSEQIGQVDNESQRRYEQHRKLAKNAVVDEIRVAHAQDAIIGGKLSRITGKDPSGSQPYSMEQADSMVSRGVEQKEAAQADLELSNQTLEAHEKQSAEWRDKNLDKLIESAKAEDNTRDSEANNTRAA